MVNLEKLQNWYDQTYYKITHLSIKTFWYNIRKWFSYYNVLRKSYDFDYTSILMVEHHQLIRVRDCISKCNSHTNAWRDIRNINWAIKCLEIVLEDGCSFSNNEKGFFEEGPDENNCYRLISNPKHKYIMPIYVNIRNRKRFYDFPLGSNIEDLYKDYLRIEKAWHLYNKIRKETLRQWWD